MPDIQPTLTEMLDAFEQYEAGALSFPLLLQIESAFYRTADAVSLDAYARKVGRGVYHGLHPAIIMERTDILKLPSGRVEFGGGIWELVHFSDARGIVKDSEFVLREILATN